MASPTGFFEEFLDLLGAGKKAAAGPPKKSVGEMLKSGADPTGPVASKANVAQTVAQPPPAAPPKPPPVPYTAQTGLPSQPSAAMSAQPAPIPPKAPISILEQITQAKG